MSTRRRQRKARAASVFAAAVATIATGEGRARAAGPITKGPWVQRVTSDSALVRVEVDPPAPVSIEVGLGLPDGDAGHHRVESAEARTLHTIRLDGLAAATRYSYAVRVGEASRSAVFVTAPSGSAPLRFLVYGDNRTDHVAHAAVVRAMMQAPSDLLVHTGDFVEDGGSAAHWQRFFEIEAPLLGARCLFSCVGNHELTDGAGIQYARFFGPIDLPTGYDPPAGRNLANTVRPEHLDGTYRWGNTRFFFINGVASFRGTLERKWLDDALATADHEDGLVWRVVVVHHGPWSNGPHGRNSQLHEAGVIAELAAHKVDLVLSGHDHIYERGWADGLAYVVSGGGGAPLYRIKSRSPQAQRAESVHHFVEVNVTETSLLVTPTRVDGSTIERCVLSKAASGWNCDPAAPGGPPPLAASSPQSPTEPKPARCACDLVGRRADAAHGGAIVLALGALAFRRRRPAGSARRS